MVPDLDEQHLSRQLHRLFDLDLVEADPAADRRAS